jgi:hypothetical protein
MQKTFSSVLFLNQIDSNEPEVVVGANAPVELEVSLLSQVGGGLGPNDNWLSNVACGPNDNW